MRLRKFSSAALVAAAAAFIVLSPGCGQESVTLESMASTNSPAQTFTFAETQGYINQYCVSCHLTGSANGSFETYSSIMSTGYVVAGNAPGSLLCSVSQADPSPLPPNLPPVVSQAICGWIAAGALDD